MQANKNGTEEKENGGLFMERLFEEGSIRIITVVDVVREPILLLNGNLQVISGNEPFYKTFQVKPRDTEKKILYDLGNGQWNVASLRKLLEEVLSKHSFFKGFRVEHDFPSIGHKIMILNARRIYPREISGAEVFSPIILLAMEDVTEMMTLAKRLADHTNEFELKIAERTEKLESHIRKLEKKINGLKSRP